MTRVSNKEAKKVIPFGDYCYSWIEIPSEQNNFKGKVKQCKFLQVKKIKGVNIPWCKYLNLGGIPGESGWKGWDDENLALNKLKTYFGSEGKMDENFPLFLLFDQIKYCNVNILEDHD